MIRCSPPYRLVPIAIGACLQQVPGAARRVTFDLDDGTENVVHGKCDALTRTLEKLPNGLASLAATEHSTVPDSVSSEQIGQGIGIIVGIAVGGITGFQLLDLFKILEPTDAALERFQIHCTLLLHKGVAVLV